MPLNFDQPIAPRTLGKRRRQRVIRYRRDAPVTQRADIKAGLRDVGGKWNFLAGDDWQRRQIDRYATSLARQEYRANEEQANAVSEAGYSWVTPEEGAQLLVYGTSRLRLEKTPMIRLNSREDWQDVTLEATDVGVNPRVTGHARISHQDIAGARSPGDAIAHLANVVLREMAKKRQEGAQ